MFETAENNVLLGDYLDVIQVETTRAQRSLLLRHLDLVAEKNKVVNLTRITDERQAIIRHIVDSASFYPSLKANCSEANTTFLDLGTGAGFPGIPLGILSGYHGVLIDSVGKKAHAVAEFIQALGLEKYLGAQAKRVEEIAQKEPHSYDAVVARAVADLGALIEYASPILKYHGYLIVSKARIQEEEINRGNATAKLVGMTNVSRETFELPEGEGHRETLVFVKNGKSSIKLPRKNGDAVHKPLVN